MIHNATAVLAVNMLETFVCMTPTLRVADEEEECVALANAARKLLNACAHGCFDAHAAATRGVALCGLP